MTLAKDNAHQSIYGDQSNDITCSLFETFTTMWWAGFNYSYEAMISDVFYQINNSNDRDCSKYPFTYLGTECIQRCTIGRVVNAYGWLVLYENLPPYDPVNNTGEETEIILNSVVEASSHRSKRNISDILYALYLLSENGQVETSQFIRPDLHISNAEKQELLELHKKQSGKENYDEFIKDLTSTTKWLMVGLAVAGGLYVATPFLLKR